MLILIHYLDSTILDQLLIDGLDPLILNKEVLFDRWPMFKWFWETETIDSVIPPCTPRYQVQPTRTICLISAVSAGDFMFPKLSFVLILVLFKITVLGQGAPKILR